MENFGQPFFGVRLECMTPSAAHAAIVAKGYAVRWQVEDRDAGGDGSTTFSTTPPPHGVVEGGYLDGTTVHIVVSVGSGAIRFAC